MSDFDWTDERVARLKQMVAEGHSAAAIAADLGGVTRSAVLAKMHRLRLRASKPCGAPVRERIEAWGRTLAREPTVAERTAFAASIGASEKTVMAVLCGLGLVLPRAVAIRSYRRATVEAPRDVPDAAEVEAAFARTARADRAPVTLLDLTSRMCRWPVDTAEGVRFCGAPAEGVYCAHHHAIAYVPAEQRARVDRQIVQGVA